MDDDGTDAPRPASRALFVRDDALCEALDAWAAALNAASPDAPPWTRAGLARAALRRAVRERGPTGQPP